MSSSIYITGKSAETESGLVVARKWWMGRGCGRSRGRASFRGETYALNQIQALITHCERAECLPNSRFKKSRDVSRSEHTRTCIVQTKKKPIVLNVPRAHPQLWVPWGLKKVRTHRPRPPGTVTQAVSLLTGQHGITVPVGQALQPQPPTATPTMRAHLTGTGAAPGPVCVHPVPPSAPSPSWQLEGPWAHPGSSHHRQEAARRFKCLCSVRALWLHL